VITLNNQEVENTTKTRKIQRKVLDKNISKTAKRNIKPKNATNTKRSIKIKKDVDTKSNTKIKNDTDTKGNTKIKNATNTKRRVKAKNNKNTKNNTKVNSSKANKKENKIQSKALPDVFKELENIRKLQIEEQKKHSKKGKNRNAIKDSTDKLKQTSKSSKNSNTANLKGKHGSNYNILSNVKYFLIEKDPVAFVLVGVVALLGVTMFSSNYIFAQEDDSLANNAPKEIVGTFEENENVINLPEILTNNINLAESKEVMTIVQDVEFETEYYENSNLPKDEQVVTQEGVLGSEEVTFIRTYTNSEIVNDTIINVKSVSSPVTQKVDVGTNEFLANEQVHIGDIMYAKERTFLYTEPNVSSNLIGVIVQYYDVTLLEVLDDWCKVQIFDYVGYVTQASLVSSNIDPTITEKCRKQKIIKNIGEEMAINTPSGLTLDDFKIVFSNNSDDVYKIFEENSEVFYNMEQEYGINGLFLAAIGIHESAWGTSTIAQNKKNLFGYGSYDSDPYNMSFSFESYKEGIELVAKTLTKYYINEPGTAIFDNQVAVGSYYNGSTIEAVNIRYASDTTWHTKIFNIMKSLYSKLAP
jgi:beta-N-acetylglucosaminidase